MMGNNKFLLGIGLSLLIIIVVAFLYSFNDSNKQRQRENKVKEKIVSSLNDKYHDDFNVIEVNKTQNFYERTIENDDVEIENIEDSYIYNLKVESSRLISFDVVYVIYNKDNYDDYEKYNVVKAGIYDNYIYNYLLDKTRIELKKGLKNLMPKTLDLEVMMYNSMTGNDNIVVDYSLDTSDLRDLKSKYYLLNKESTMEELYQLCRMFDKSNRLMLKIKVNDFINQNNIEEFKEQVIKGVDYLKDLGFDDYDLNFSFKRYEIANVSRYDESEKILLIFDYESYSDVAVEERLYSFILD